MKTDIGGNEFGRTEYIVVQTENGPIVVEIDEGGIEWADNVEDNDNG
jgi:hypothetical protein